MTQKELLIEYIKQNGFAIPAKMSGLRFMGGFFGSETSKRARELRKAGILESHPEGKFEVFTLVPREELNGPTGLYKLPESQKVWKL